MRPKPTATWAIAVLLTWTALARAEIPSPANCTLPPRIWIVGADANGVPDPRGAFIVVLRDASMNPLPGYTVTIQLGGCGELKGCKNIFEVCSPAAAQAVTNAQGVATLVVVGGRSSGAQAQPDCAEIFGQGVPLGHRSASAFDLDGVPGVNPLDISRCFGDVNSGTYFARSDYDGDGDVDALDISTSAGIVNGGGSTHGCPTGICP
jgi:hypothetical protein